VFEAIRIANPGGLGQSENYDVHLYPDCTLAVAMAAARDRDLIAKQYVTGFSDIFDSGLISLKGFTERWNDVEWAIVACYLNFMSLFRDSHIMRKYGYETAEDIRLRSANVFDCFKNNNNPEDARPLLLDFDRELKDANINPGTSADLTAASLLVYRVVEH